MEENFEKKREEEDEINLLDLLIVLAKHKKLIIGGTLGAGVIMVVISLIMTPIYLAETKIYIPQSSNSISAQMISQLGPMAGLVGAAKTPNDLYIEILKSRPARDRIIERFGLMKAYATKSQEQAEQALLANIKARQDLKSGVITFGVEDTDPKRSAAMANAFIEEFRNLNKALALTEASQRRLFFEEQLENAKDSLAKAENAMQSFQEATGAVKIDAQASAVIEGIAQLRALIAAKEVQLRVMRTYSTPQNPDIQRAEEELKGLRAQMRQMESKNSSDSVIVPTGNLPSTGTEYLRHMRDLKYNETLYELLLTQYQSAKLDEARYATVVQIIEKAQTPERKIRPRSSILVVSAMILSLLVSLCVIIFLEYREKASHDLENIKKYDILRSYLSFGHTEKEDSKNKLL